MKRIIFSLLLLFALLSNAQEEFITVWNPSNSSLTTPQTNETQIKIPIYGGPYSIYWEEVGYPEHKNTITNLIDPVIIDFGSPQNQSSNEALYIVKISGLFDNIAFIDQTGSIAGDCFKIIEISQWGTNKWKTNENAFMLCHILDISAVDKPNLSSNLNRMFYNCESLKGNSSMNNWDTSNVTNMNQMFYNAKQFNQSIGNWDVGNVITMVNMFGSANLFNQFIGNWDTSNVKNMSSMFSGALAFNQSMENWDTSNVEDMSFMFAYAFSFNQPIGKWITTNVVDMSYMFQKANSFNQPIGEWDTSNVKKMIGMFSGRRIDNIDDNLPKTIFNQSIADWNTSNVIDMSYMFSGTRDFNQSIGDWNTSNVVNMKYMFYEANSFNQPIGNWDISMVDNMSSMFEGAISFNQSLTNWNTISLIYTDKMFFSASNFNQSIGNFKLNKYIDFGNIISYCGMDCVNYDATLIGWSSNPNVPGNKKVGASGRKYSSQAAQNARNSLINIGWTFYEDNLDENCHATLNKEDLITENNLKLYPNPVQNEILFDVNNLTNPILEIFDINGNLLKKENIKKGLSSISIQNIEPGLYIFKILSQEGTKIEKIIKN